MNDKGLTQENIAAYAEIDPSQMSRIFRGSVQISVWHIAKIASKLEMQDIDLYTYPDIYEKKVEQQAPTQFLLGIKIQNDNIEINQFCLNNILTIN